jgi:hypothetical protein
MPRAHGAATTIRSSPPLRNSAAFAHQRSSAGSCAPRPTASIANDAASADQLSYSHRFTVFGHAPVDPISAHTP